MSLNILRIFSIADNKGFGIRNDRERGTCWNERAVFIATIASRRTTKIVMVFVSAFCYSRACRLADEIFTWSGKKCDKCKNIWESTRNIYSDLSLYKTRLCAKLNFFLYSFVLSALIWRNLDHFHIILLKYLLFLIKILQFS